ncbi:hypothetical protein B0T20DRAFT_427005 [Sordaria brevicollis]|uniref:Uncharacterized protein n=1 Tax=Sordaria brevicollis TaxID=83679 RepID=A0AAE0NUS5_SORBR|nr:hypothetical protein B0T20DRAFT_427005 [Sordaria brevicollis]
MADPPPLLAAAAADDSHSSMPQVQDPTLAPNSPAIPPPTIDSSKGLFYTHEYPPRTIPHHSPFFGVFRSAYEKADASLVSESLRSWPEKYSHAEPEAVVFGPPGNTGTNFTSLKDLDHDTARRIEIIRRGARAAGWDVFFARVRAMWSGPRCSKLHANVSHRPWPDRHESALFEHLRRPADARSYFDVMVMSIHDLDGESVVPPWASNYFGSRFSLQTIQTLLHEELFCMDPAEESFLHFGDPLEAMYQGWIRQLWHADTILLVPQAQSLCTLSRSLVVNSPVDDDQAQQIAKYFVGLALQDTAGFSDHALTVRNAYMAIDLLYKVMDATTWGPVNARTVMGPSVKSQIIKFAGEQRDHPLFLRACTLHNRFDSAPDQQLLVSWLEALLKKRLLMSFWSPHLQNCLTQVILSYQNLHDRVEFVLALPKQITGQGLLAHLPVTSWLKPFIIPEDLRTPLLCSTKDGGALGKAALSFGKDSTVVAELITALRIQMQLPAEPMPWIAGCIESLHLSIAWSTRRQLCAAFVQFDHFLTAHHKSEYLQAWVSRGIDIVGFFLYLGIHVDRKLYDEWLADLCRSVRQWEDPSTNMHAFMLSVYKEICGISLLDSLSTDILKQVYRVQVRTFSGFNGRSCLHRDLTRRPPRPVDPNDHVAMEGYRFLIDPSQETARFRWTALERDLVKWIWADTGVEVSLDESSHPPTMVVRKLSASTDEWFKHRKASAKSCRALEKMRHDKLEDRHGHEPQDLVDWSFADGTGPDPAWVSEDDPAEPLPEAPRTPRREVLAQIVSPRSSPTFASPTSSEANWRDQSITEQKPDDKPAPASPPDPVELTKEEALMTLSLEEYMLRRAKMEVKDLWDRIREEDNEDLEELYVLLGRRKSLGPKAYITEEVLHLVQNPAEGLVIIGHQRRWLMNTWIRRLWEHRKGIKLITPADDPVFKHSKWGIKRKRGMDDDSEDDDDEEDDGWW